MDALSLGRAEGSTDGDAVGSGVGEAVGVGVGSGTDDGDIQPAARDRCRRCLRLGRDLRMDVQARVAGVRARRERERGLPPVLRDVGERRRGPQPVIAIDELVGLTLLDVVVRVRRDHDPAVTVVTWT